MHVSAYGFPSPFQSTLSMRRATMWWHGAESGNEISIHALHEESDRNIKQLGSYSHTFQSTLSMRRATDLE